MALKGVIAFNMCHFMQNVVFRANYAKLTHTVCIPMEPKDCSFGNYDLLAYSEILKMTSILLRMGSVEALESLQLHSVV